MRKFTQTYAIYKGDNLITMGNVQECAKRLNVTPSTIYWYSQPSAKKRDPNNTRLIAVRCGGTNEE